MAIWKCTTCDVQIPKGKYCKKCIAGRRRELARAARANRGEDYSYHYYRRKKAEERAKLKLKLRPCQESVNELNEKYPWLAQVDNPKIWRGEIPAHKAA